MKRTLIGLLLVVCFNVAPIWSLVLPDGTDAQVELVTKRFGKIVNRILTKTYSFYYSNRKV